MQSDVSGKGSTKSAQLPRPLVDVQYPQLGRQGVCQRLEAGPELPAEHDDPDSRHCRHRVASTLFWRGTGHLEFVPFPGSGVVHPRYRPELPGPAVADERATVEVVNHLAVRVVDLAVSAGSSDAPTQGSGIVDVCMVVTRTRAVHDDGF